jgi:hypothetical protein
MTPVYLSIAIVITLIAAAIEAHGYNYGFQAFKDGTINPNLAVLSFILYSLGIIVDYIGLHVMSKSTIYIPEILSTIFMVGTIVGIALLSGQFFTWKTADQAVAIAVVVGIGWLTYRVDK